MKVWSIIIDFIAIMMIMVIVNTFYTQQAAYEKDFDTARLQLVIDYATESAFIESISTADLSLSYDDMSTVDITPGRSLDILRELICINYNISLSEDNINSINDSIQTIVMACDDGYYVLPSLMEREFIYELSYDWGWKRPYMLSGVNGKTRVNMTSKSGIFINEKTVPYSVEEFGDFEVYLSDILLPLYKGYMSALTVKNDTLGIKGAFDRAKNKEINSTITNAMVNSIYNTIRYKGDREYKVYIPDSNTSGGVNSVRYPSLIVVMDGGKFAEGASMAEVSMAGLKTIKKINVIGYTEISTGKKYYCYETQMELYYAHLYKVERFFTDINLAARAGYYPDLRYICNIIKR